MSNDSKQENKGWYNGSGHEQNARASGACCSYSLKLKINCNEQ